MRIKIISFVIIFIFLFLFLNLLNLAVIRGKNFKELSSKNYIRLLPQQGSRGRILDRKGQVIVDNFLSYDVMILPEREQRIDKILMNVSGVLGLSVKDLKDAFKNNYIAPFAPITIAKNIDIKKAILLEELKSDLPGVIIQPHPQRRYPYDRLACHVIGYLNEIDHWRLTKLKDYGYKTKDIVGFGGIEERYDYYLRQEEGGMQVEVDHLGRFMRVLGFRPPKNGLDIQLTLDLKLQKIVEENLGARVGCVILMEPYSGEILAMASRPNFNPSVFVKNSDYSVTNIFNNPNAPLINRAISGVYPAGSLFKLIVATAALETAKINLSTTFSCTGSIYIGRQEFSCWNTHDRQNLWDAITHSCNIFFYRTGLLLGPKPIHDYALRFGLSRVTSIDLPYEANGFVSSPLWRKIHRFSPHWFDGDTVNLAIGQGDLLVTPLQMVRMMAVFANKGKLVNPHIVKVIDGRQIHIYQKKITDLSIKESALDYIRQALRNVVSQADGTASLLGDLAISIAGKTGTAQVSRGQPHAWFVGFLPFKNPKFVICVFIEHGGSGHTASVLAREIIENMLNDGLI